MCFGKHSILGLHEQTGKIAQLCRPRNLYVSTELVSHVQFFSSVIIPCVQCSFSRRYSWYDCNPFPNERISLKFPNKRLGIAQKNLKRGIYFSSSRKNSLSMVCKFYIRTIATLFSHSRESLHSKLLATFTSKNTFLCYQDNAPGVKWECQPRGHYTEKKEIQQTSFRCCLAY